MSTAHSWHVTKPFMFHFLMEPLRKTSNSVSIIFRQRWWFTACICPLHGYNLIAIAMRVPEHQTASRLELFNRMDVFGGKTHTHTHNSHFVSRFIQYMNVQRAPSWLYAAQRHSTDSQSTMFRQA